MTKVKGLNLCNATCGVGRRMAKTVAPEKVSRLDREFLENGSKKLTKLFAAIFFLFLLGVGNVWGDSYTITFSNSANSATAITSSVLATTTIASASRTYVTTSPYTVNSGKCYYGDTQSCIRIGKSGETSSLSIALSTTGQVYATSIVVNCNNTGGKNNSNATLSVNGEEAQTTSETANDYTFDIDDGNITSITLEGSASIKIYSITVNYTTATTYSVTYNLNGGSGTTPTETNKASGATFTLHNGTSSITAPAGKSFNQWKDQDDDLYSGGATYTMPAKNVTLTAQWSCITPTISGHPAAATYWDMDSPTALTVTASGGSLSYQWQMSADGSSSWSNVGTNSSSYTPLVANGTKYYRCIVTNTGSSCNTTATSNNALVTIKTLSSIAVKTSPQTTYFAGETFSPTNLVITLTASDASTQDRSYASYSSGFTFSPTTATALTDDDDKVTITYGGKTVDQSINVYTVTVNKVNMSGTAITNASVTATCSGRTLSQSVGSTNYKFNSWNVTAGGVSVSDNSITGTPTDNVTINAKFHDPITVTWKVGNGAASGGTGEVKYGTKVSSLPSDPADNALASCGTNKFMGWSKNELTGTGNSAPADLFNSTSDAGCAALTENTTYRAVFASSSSGAVANTVLFSENWEGVTASTTPSSPTASGSEVYGSASISYSWSNGSGNSTTQTYTDGGPNSDENILIAKSDGYWKVTGIKTGNASKIVFTYAKSGSGTVSVSSPTSNVSVGGSSSGSYITFTGEVSTFDLEFKNTNSSNNLRLDDIEVKVYTAGTTAEDYQTGCCEAPASALSITSANSVATGGTVSLTSTGGNGGTVTWSVVNGTGTASVAGTTLTAGSIGTVTVKAHQDANTVLGTEYCAQDAEQTFTVVSSTVNVTGVEVSPTSKAIVPGETFTITPTISPSNATDKSVSWTSSASDKASVSSGTVTGVAAGTATITCTTTDGSYTATTAVTVYGVTMQALDEDGNAIAVGGPGTPSRSGANISPAADAGNYVFKEWAISGASLGSSASTKANTITNPTGAVTVTAKYYKPRTVKWSVNGDNTYDEGSPTLTVAYNSAISAVPDAPADNTLNNCANKFMGWSTKSAGSTAKTTSYYDDLFTSASGYTTGITDVTTTFYAVFAERDGAAENTVMWSENWTGVTSGKKPSQYDGTGRTVYNGGSVTYTESGSDCNVKAESYAGGSSPELYIKGGEWWNIANIPTGGATTLTLTYMSNNDADVTTTTGKVAVGTTSSSGNTRTRTITISGDVSNFDLKFAKSSNTRVDNVSVKVATSSYDDYVTECASNQVRVTYDFNGGSGTACSEGVTTKTASYTVCTTTPTKDYYNFNKWNDGTNSYAAGATGYNLQANTTFTAQWTPTSYDINYENMEGATNALVNVGTYNIETATITLGTPTRGHDRFDGWFTDDGVWSDEVTEIPLGSHGDITLYAKWTERYHIEFYKDGVSLGEMWRAEDENMEDAVAGQGSVPSDPSAPTTCSSKDFVGWTTNDDYDSDTRPTDLMKPAAGSVDADKEYHAVWATSTSGSKTLVMEITRADFDASYHDGATQDHSSIAVANDGSGATLSVDWKSVNVGDFSSKIQIKNESGAEFWNTTDLGSISSVSINSGNNITHFENTSAHPTSTAGSTQGYFTVTKDGGVGTASKVTVTFTKTISYYNAYATSCCTKYDITGASTSGTAVEVNDKTGGTLTSSHNSRCAGKNVTLSAAVNTGYQFNGWTITGSTSGDDLTSLLDDATSLTPAAFAMPSEGITVEADITEQVVTAWSWTYDDDDIPNPLELYVGEKKTVNVTYTPSTIINTHKSYDHVYGAGATTYITATKAQAYCTIKGNKATNDETLTLTHVDDSSGDFAQVIHVKVTPLPVDHYLDLVHGVEFADQAATATDGVVTLTYTAPGSDQDEWDDEYANTCEQTKVKLVGWVESEYADACIAADTFPTTDALKADSEHFFAVGATMTASNKTYYAVWAEIE